MFLNIVWNHQKFLHVEMTGLGNSGVDSDEPAVTNPPAPLSTLTGRLADGWTACWRFSAGGRCGYLGLPDGWVTAAPITSATQHSVVLRGRAQTSGDAMAQAGRKWQGAAERGG